MYYFFINLFIILAHSHTYFTLQDNGIKCIINLYIYLLLLYLHICFILLKLYYFYKYEYIYFR